MSLKIYTGEKGYMLDIDGIESEAHRYGHAVITAGPSGALYGCLITDPDEGKPQLYKLMPVDSLHEEVILDEDTDGGYVEDGMYDEGEDEDDGEGEVEDEEEDEGEDEGEDEDDGNGDDGEEESTTVTPAA